MLSTYQNNEKVRIPNLVKWAGGKGNLIETLMHYIPKKFETYCEPFFGGGSLFWNLKLKGVIEEAVISDINPDLINLLNIVKDHTGELSDELRNYTNINGVKQYYMIRNRFNSIPNTKKLSVEKAALFLYLNRNCYNGLWRINRKGEFNVPFGFYKKYYIPSSNDLETYSELLRNTKIILGDFSVSLKLCKEGDFVYLDPPYYSLSGFTEYAGSKFTWREQSKLADFFRVLSDKGVRLVESNSNHPDILELYHGFKIIQAKGYSIISSKNNGRGITDELIIIS